MIPEVIRSGQRELCVKDDLGDLSVLYRGAVVVARGVAEGEAGLGAGGRGFVGHFTHSFGAIVRVWSLEGGTRDVVDTGQDLHWFLKHDPECVGGTVAAEACVVLTQDSVAVCVNDRMQSLVPL